MVAGVVLLIALWLALGLPRLGAGVGALLSGAIITETVFNLPGIGREVFNAVKSQDGAVVVGIVTFLILVYMAANLFVDFLYAVLDPRIRYE